MVFGQISDIPGAGPVIEEHTSVTFSPQQFKFFSSVAMNAMEDYEKTFGKLTFLEELTRTPTSADQVMSGLQGMLSAVLPPHYCCCKQGRVTYELSRLFQHQVRTHFVC
jgi:hypothetical protein